MDMRETFTIDGSHFSNMAGFYDEVERVFTFGLDLIFTQEHYSGTILTIEKLLFSSGRRTMRSPITAALVMRYFSFLQSCEFGFFSNYSFSPKSI